jgi:hypothetical protein
VVRYVLIPWSWLVIVFWPTFGGICTW